MKKPAMFYETLHDHDTGKETGVVLCTLCPHSCRISPGKKGLCSVRINERGTLFAESYGRITSIALDPIEKKPLRRFHPKSSILSIGSYGCNFQCGFCQNHGISMGKPPFQEMTPSDVARISRQTEPQGNIGVAYTYNEPLIGYEFVWDCVRLLRDQDQKNVLVTNGFIQTEPLLKLLPYIDAMNIDLKSFTEGFYKNIGGEIIPVKNTIKTAAARCHVEITTLIVGGQNDGEEEMEVLAAWLSEIDREIPLHISRFFPSHQMADARPTPVATIHRLIRVAKQHLKYVYAGNCPEE